MWYNIPFSTLWSPTTCNIFASLSAAICFLDIAMLCHYHYIHQPSKLPPARKYHYDTSFLISNFVLHFTDAKVFHYVPVEYQSEWNDIIPYAVSIFICIYILGRLFFSGACAQIERPNSGDLNESEPAPSNTTWEILRFVMMGGGVVVYALFLGFLIVYYLVTVQLIWLMKAVINFSGE